jgi:protein ImuA
MSLVVQRSVRNGHTGQAWWSGLASRQAGHRPSLIAYPVHQRFVLSPEGRAEHSEVFAPSSDASGAALALALALDAARAGEDRSWLWVQDRAALRLSGRPYRPGLPPGLRGRLIHVTANTPEDALFALEEGLRCRDLSFVIGEIAGNPRALSFTAQRRLSLAAEKHGVPLWLVRLDAARDLSSARQRWEARAAPSQASRWNAHAPGPPAWQAELFRSRSHPPRAWVLGEVDGMLVHRTGQDFPPQGERVSA